MLINIKVTVLVVTAAVYPYTNTNFNRISGSVIGCL